ncbi:hypothetical protein ET495_04495 [Xylanimonas allomyrinae]|uniref:Uncharacterized protein n=1 Tax=Xylanimonas allomyrinae TaxID=2509459 RepID=A0A4P6EQQ4_9MICO|nr:SpaA isopeptide-forming pilin-related protein [Xylanimonas allomyrinae]QAY62637.1 hypothetical protein ET495_04495 [Xylanimonas allomyrinae]
MRKHLTPWIVALVAVVALLLDVPAAAAAVDPDRSCTLTVRASGLDATGSPSGTPGAGLTLVVERVPGLDLTTPEGRDAARDLLGTDTASVAAEQVAQAVTDGTGEVVFRNLAVGLYRVREVAPAGLDTVDPFLVMLPTADPDTDGRWLYDVVAYPKAARTRSHAVYDLALRTWVSEIWRDGTLIFERMAPTTHPGPDFVVPHVTFDRDDVDIQVGDLVVHDIHLFNQGNRTARVDEIVSYFGDGLDHAATQYMNTVPGHDNDGWQLGTDGLWHLSLEDAGIVLAPHEEYEVHHTLRVTPQALATGADSAVVPSFAEISKFSGWVPAQAETASAGSSSGDVMSVPDSGVVAAGWAAQPLLGDRFDGVVGTWGAVADVDSTPDRVNGAVEGSALVYHSWEDNEIGESNTSMSPDDGVRDYDNDEDDHDGALLLVVGSAPSGVSPVGRFLPRTGADVAVMLAVAGGLVVAGGAVVRVAGRRRGSDC